MISTACEPSPFESVGVLEPPRLGEALRQVEAFLKSYIVFPSGAQAPAIALWVAHSHALAAFEYTPYLHISSPEKRCGKSRVLDALKQLVPAPWLALSPSDAVIYRKIATSMPTLLLDEVDTIFTNGKDENKEGLRALLNGGYTRGATVPRCTGTEHKIEEFPVFCPKVIAGIGRLPETVADRSIPIVLARKAKHHDVMRFREREAAEIAGGIRKAFETWVRSECVLDDLRAARPLLPDALGDRQADICEPLLAIADAAGGDWPERARAALVELFTEGGETGESVGVKLLAAFRRIFAEADATRLTTDQILDALMLSDDGPWVGWWERDISAGNRRGPAFRMANILKPYGIASITLRSGDDTRKGYKIEHFFDAWDRYLPNSQKYDAPGETEQDLEPF